MRTDWDYEIDVNKQFLKDNLIAKDYDAVIKYIEQGIPFESSIARFIMNNLASKVKPVLKTSYPENSFALKILPKFTVNSPETLTFELELRSDMEFDNNELGEIMNNKLNSLGLEILYL